MLLVAQIAICAVLVTSSFVAVRGLARALHDKFGFDPQHSILVSADLHAAGYGGDRAPVMQQRILDALEEIPGLDAVGLTDALLLNDGNLADVFRDTDSDLSAGQAAARPYVYHISPAYLQAEGTALLEGRPFTRHDDKASTRVAIVNSEFARKVFGTTRAALGRHFKMPDGALVEVVGIAEDGKDGTLTEDPHAALFLPILQWPSNSAWIVVRSYHDSEHLTEAIRRALQRVDQGLPVQVERRSDEMATVLFGPKMATVALGIFGVMGAMLSITGIFGLAAYTVSKRMHELGIRVALGAKRAQVLGAALGRAFRLLGFGSAAGLVLGLLATRVLALIVYQATPGDPLVLVGAIVAMLSIGLVAAAIPARRALSIDPMILLRDE